MTTCPLALHTAKFCMLGWTLSFPQQNEDIWQPPAQGEVQDDDGADAMPAPKMQAPLPCDIALCEGDRWNQVLMTGNEYYSSAIRKVQRAYTGGPKDGGGTNT